jgi:putative methionine-R-sulfoxide reductase with GAF domain
MGDDPMRKADLMDEIRSKIGVVADKLEGDIEALYRYVIETLYEHVPTYRYVGIYLTHGCEFVRFHHAGYSSHPPVIRFGQGLHSLAAARGKLVRERVGRWTEVLVPFYRGHHLIGELVVIGEPEDGIDEEDLALFREIASLLEAKVEECNSSRDD